MDNEPKNDDVDPMWTEHIEKSPFASLEPTNALRALSIIIKGSRPARVVYDQFTSPDNPYRLQPLSDQDLLDTVINYADLAKTLRERDNLDSAGLTGHDFFWSHVVEICDLQRLLIRMGNDGVDSLSQQDRNLLTMLPLYKGAIALLEGGDYKKALQYVYQIEMEGVKIMEHHVQKGINTASYCKGVDIAYAEAVMFIEDTFPSV